jgi:hypothetical protein
MGEHVVAPADRNTVEGKTFLTDLLYIWTRRTAEMDVEVILQLPSQWKNEMINGEINCT